MVAQDKGHSNEEADSKHEFLVEILASWREYLIRKVISNRLIETGVDKKDYPEYLKTVDYVFKIISLRNNVNASISGIG